MPLQLVSEVEASARIDCETGPIDPINNPLIALKRMTCQNYELAAIRTVVSPQRVQPIQRICFRGILSAKYPIVGNCRIVPVFVQGLFDLIELDEIQDRVPWL